MAPRKVTHNTMPDELSGSAYEAASSIGGPPDPGVHDVDGDPGKYVSPRPGRRRQVEVNAESGRALDTKTANLLTGAVTAPTKRHLSVKETVENSDPHVRAAYLDHLFLPPGRDRA